MTPIKSIRAKCLDCCAGQTKEVRLCPSTDCALYPYRMGHRPKSNENSELSNDSEGKESEE